jgi:TonB-linked SusC/RagA family outer membrane protein
MQKIFTLLLVSSFLVPSLFAQQEQRVMIRGTVIDEMDKTPMVGVTVVEMDHEGRTVGGVGSDISGNYALKIHDPNNKIVFSFIGYKTVTQDINGRTVINIALQSDSKHLNVVEIVAERTSNNGMVDVRERDLTTAVSKVEFSELAEVQALSVDQALQGRMAGVDIVANSGDPGAGMSIRIRGTSSINQSANPLIVVDGMPYDIEVSSDFNFATADEQGYAQLLNIAPSDIKDITVLRDAAATAVWGSRASNGVLVINTKRGVTGKPRISYTLRTDVTKQPDPIPLLSGDQYSTLIQEGVMNRNGTPLNTVTVKEFQYDPGDPYWYFNYSNNTDWIDAITRTGFSHDHNLSLQGGGEKASYFASLGYNNTKGTTIGTDFRRINARINLDFFVSTRIRFRSDFSFTHVENNLAYNVSGRNNDPLNPRAIAYTKMPNMSIFEYDAYGNNTGNYFSPERNIQNTYPTTYNPLALLHFGKERNYGDRIRPIFNINYEIIPDVLNTSIDIAFDINNSKTNRFLPQIATGQPSSSTLVNRAEDIDTDKLSVQTKWNLVYTPVFKEEKHSVSALLSFQTFDDKQVGYGAITSNSASSLLQDPSDPSRTQNSELKIGSGETQNRGVGLLLNVQYGLLDRYIINAGVRVDGNSKFGRNNRFGTFPTLSARWRISGEQFMSSLTFLDDLSLRMSIGSSGNAPRKNYLYFSQYNNFAWEYQGQSGVYPANMELENLKWETVIQKNIGFNFSALKGKYLVNVDVYQKRTKDLFFEDLQMPSTTGFPSVDMNVGVMDNLGWELNISYQALRQEDLSIRFDLNIARNFNVIREISNLYPQSRGSISGNGQYLTRLQVDNPLGSFYGFRYKGVYSDQEATIARDANGDVILDANEVPRYMRFNYPVVDYMFQPGDAKYEDINHDGNINHLDVVYLGNSNPLFVGGFGPTITYKNFKLNVFFNFRYKFDVINSGRMSTENMYNYSNQSTAALRRWRRPGDETDIPRALINYGYNWLGSDRFVEDASFLRVKFITLRYDFDAAVARKIGAQQLNVYVTTTNLFTFTKYRGQDPEVSSRSSDLTFLGYDNSLTPPVKQFTLGLNARF